MTDLIFLVDDNDELRIALEEFITTLGYEVRAYSAAEDALLAFDARRNKLRLLITDVVLPGQDGISLAHRMRRTMPELPVLVISADLQQPPAAMSFADSGFELMRKPIALDALARKIAICRRPNGRHVTVD